MNEVSQKEKNKCINAYMWNLEKWYRWAYLQGRNKDTDVENGHVHGHRPGRGGWDELESRTDTCYVHTGWKVVSGELLCSTGSLAPCFVMTWGWRGGWGRSKREGLCVYIKQTHDSTAETNATLQSSNLKKKKKRNSVKQFWELGDMARRLIFGKQGTRKGTQS